MRRRDSVDRGGETGRRRAAYRSGLWAELAAAAFLAAKGYRIAARRYRCPSGEIDLIARRGRTIAFVEVKTRARLDDAAWAVTPRQRRRIVRAARHWIAHHRAAPGSRFRFDVMLLARGRLPLHIAGAFEADRSGGGW